VRLFGYKVATQNSRPILWAPRPRPQPPQDNNTAGILFRFCDLPQCGCRALNGFERRARRLLLKSTDHLGLIMQATLTRPAVLPELLDVRAVAELLGCSSRHVYQMVKTGAMPRPVKLGVLNRWPQGRIQKWIADGCPRNSR
jgi:predicted DNA-binding transcriptional regulator AlpA